MEEIRTWHLDEASIPEAIAKLEKINVRAARNGLAGRYSWRLGAEHREPVYLDDSGLPVDGQNAKPDYYKITRELIVDGEAPKLSGGTFLARLTWDAGTLVTRCTPGFEGRIDDAAIRPGACDHCRTDRDRRDCYLVEGDNGQRAQVGSSCVKDFLGQAFQPSWLTYVSDLDDLGREMGGRRETLVASPLEVLAYAASLTSQTGWISRAKAEEQYREASSGILQYVIFPAGAKDREARHALAPTAGNRAEAASVLSWAQALEPGNSEYLANVKRLAQADLIGVRNVGVLGSAVASHHREMNAKAEREAAPVSEWFGNVKDKVELRATVRSDTPVEGDYGIRHRYAFTTPEGNSVIWWASSGQGLEPGQEITLRGSIKGHEEYREVRNTVMTRCKWEPTPAVAGEPGEQAHREARTLMEGAA